MDKSLLFAVDETGKRHYPQIEEKDGIIHLTFKKEKLRDVAQLHMLPALARANAGDAGFFVTPRSASILRDPLVLFDERPDARFEYGSPIMSCYGIKTPAVCALVRIERTYRYRVAMNVTAGVYRLETLFDFTSNDPIYEDIRIEVLPLPENATLGDMAAAERKRRLEKGEIIPLSEKCKAEAVEYARKYPLIRIRMGWKQSTSPVKHQTLENEPEMQAVVTFARVRDIADALKSAGVEGAELQLVGWNIGGHDGRFPQLMPADPKLGGTEELKKTIQYVKKLGYRISLHTNSINAYEIADCFTWDDIVVSRDGEYNQNGHYSGGLAYNICPEKQLKNAKRDLPELAELGLNGLHFTDVISIVQPDVCCSKEHPCNTQQGVALAQENMRYTRELLGGFSSEGCMDFAMGIMDYGLYTTMGSSFIKYENKVTEKMVPFFELTYHGIVLYNPNSATVNYLLKAPEQQLCVKMHGGRPTFYFHSKFRYREVNWMGDTDLIATDNTSLAFAANTIAKGCKEYEPLRDLQLVYMKEYEILGNGVEVATYCNGIRMVGNFSDSQQSFEGNTIAAYDMLVLR